jgi:U3 small nucleolar RNA-associated protein 21
VTRITRCQASHVCHFLKIDSIFLFFTMSTASPPPRKRLRQSETNKSKEPRLFVPFRALGLITNHVPFVVQTRSFKGANGPRIHLLTCLGRSWALWEGGRMTLLFVSKYLSYTAFEMLYETPGKGPETADPMSCLHMDGDAVWAASGPHAIKYIRGKEVSRCPSWICLSPKQSLHRYLA